MQENDTDLVRKAQQGDMSAFEQLVFRHDKQVIGIAARYASNAEDAKDIYQEVFIRVYRNIRRFRFKSDFATWVHRITVNVCLTHKARSKRRMHISIDERQEDEDGESHGRMELRADTEPPDEAAHNARVAEEIMAAVGTLSPQQRLVFTMKYLEGYTLKEIAHMMNCAEGTIKRYLFTATARVRALMAGRV
jgi:RNA polymerase sigma-70 factor (ECF subfamily)